jgi:hypothetical protein
VQAGWEKALTVLLAAMGGSNYVHHAAGMLESMLTVAYEQYVIDDEIIGMCCKVLKGIEVDPEHLALEVIDEVGRVATSLPRITPLPTCAKNILQETALRTERFGMIGSRKARVMQPHGPERLPKKF